MIYILLLIFFLSIPIVIECRFNKDDELEYSVLSQVLWGLVVFRYQKDQAPFIRISFLSFSLKEEKKVKPDYEFPLKEKKEKKEKKAPSKILESIEIQKLYLYRRMILRIIRKIFQVFFISGNLRCRYSTGNPALNGMSYGYLSPFLEIMNSGDFMVDIFPEFSKFELEVTGRGEIKIKTYVFMFLFFASRIFKDALKLKKEFIDGKS